MRNTKYLDVTDHLNKAPYHATIPASYVKLSAYELEFGVAPLYQPTAPTMMTMATVTISDMIEMHFNNMVFQLSDPMDAYEIYDKTKEYLVNLHNVQNKTLEQENYFRRTYAFLEEVAKLCKITDTRIEKTKPIDRNSLSGMLSIINKLWSPLPGKDK